MFVSPKPRDSLVRSLEILSELASSPLQLTDRQLERARAFLGLLLLHIVDPTLSAEMYAMMTCAGIPLRGETEWRIVKGRRIRVHKLPDPDSARRKGLRRFLNRLTEKHILRDIPAEYVPNSLGAQGVAILGRVPQAGIIAWRGIIHVKKPRGEKTKWMYVLEKFQPSQYPSDLLFQLVEPDRMDSTIRETCALELKGVYNSLQKLQRINRLDIERTMAAKLEPIVYSPLESKRIAQIAYVFTCFARPRGLMRLLPSAVQLAALELSE